MPRQWSCSDESLAAEEFGCLSFTGGRDTRRDVYCATATATPYSAQRAKDNPLYSNIAVPHYVRPPVLLQLVVGVQWHTTPVQRSQSQDALLVANAHVRPTDWLSPLLQHAASIGVNAILALAAGLHNRRQALPWLWVPQGAGEGAGCCALSRVEIDDDESLV